VFSGEVTSGDLQRANTSPFRQVLLVLYVLIAIFLLLVTGLVALALGSKLLRGRALSPDDVIILGMSSLALLCFAFLIGAYFARGWILARRLPHLLGDTHGWLSQKVLFQKRVKSETEFNMEVAQSIRIRRDCLMIRFHPSPLIFDVIPMRAFERPEAVRAFVNDWNRRRVSVISPYTDPRRLSDVAVPATEKISVDSVSIAGQVTTDDIRASPVYRLLRRAIWIYLTIGIGFPSLAIGFGWSTFSGLTLTSLLFPWIFWRAYQRSFGPLMKPNVPVRYASGYLGAEMLCQFSFFESSRIKWSHFRSMEANESTISLEHCGKMKMFTLFARRQFASESDWKSAIEIMERAIPKRA
jgi:hypothetical protein